jgi:hypothetical protein
MTIEVFEPFFFVPTSSNLNPNEGAGSGRMETIELLLTSSFTAE